MQSKLYFVLLISSTLAQDDPGMSPLSGKERKQMTCLKTGQLKNETSVCFHIIYKPGHIPECVLDMALLSSEKATETMKSFELGSGQICSNVNYGYLVEIGCTCIGNDANDCISKIKEVILVLT
ncbi:hypothetical protein V3C99_009787 [Haemonchus contortus]